MQKKPWKIVIEPRSIALRNRRGTGRQKFVRMDGYVEGPDIVAIDKAAEAVGITRSDAMRQIIREAVESGVLVTALGNARIQEFLPPSGQSPQSSP